MVEVRQRHRRHDGVGRRPDRNRDHQARRHRRAGAGIPDASLNLVCTVWSPDDKRLACEGFDETHPLRNGIYSVRSSDGGGLVRLTKTPANMVDFPGDYSPDGTQFLFKRTTEEAPGPLMVVPAAGGQPKPFRTSWSRTRAATLATERTILTSSDGYIVLLSAAGREIGRFGHDGTFLFGAVWSPDGSHIAYSGDTGSAADIYTSLPDGTDQHQVTSTATTRFESSGAGTNGTRSSAHRLLVSLPHDRCLARLGLGARVVALISAAHDSSCGSHLACVTRAPPGRERLKRGLLSSK